MPPCEGCTARADEIGFLRAQVKELQAQTLAASNPPAYAQITGKGAGAPAQEYHTDENGQTWVTVEGRDIRIEAYRHFLAENGTVALSTGEHVPLDEFQRVANKMQEGLSGGSVEEMLNGSHRAQ